MSKKPRKDEDNMFKKLVHKKYSKPSSLKSEVFAEEVFKFCSNNKNLEITRRKRYCIFRFFENSFKKELAQCPDVSQDLLLYKETYYDLDNSNESMPLNQLEVEEFAVKLKKMIINLFPLSSFELNVTVSRNILFVLKMPMKMEKGWIEYA